MAAEQERKDVELKTFDGLTLRGSLYVGPKGGPAVIVNGAVSLPWPYTTRHIKSTKIHSSNTF